MYYKKENGIHVPFGLLRYTRRATYESKNYLIVDMDDKALNTNLLHGEVPPANTTVLAYSVFEPIITRRMAILEDSIVRKTLPPFPGLQDKKQEDWFDENIPAYRCNTCPFKKECWKDR